MAATARHLFSSPLVTVADVRCDTPRSGCGRELCGERSSITVIRRGVHAYHARGRTALAEPGLALLYRSGEPYRLSHPWHREVPDRSTCVEFGLDLLEEAFGAAPLLRDLGTALSPRAQVLSHRLVVALDGDASDRLAGEEAAMALVRAVSGDFALARADLALSTSAERRVARARAFIAADPVADHGLDDVAAAAACSPFHLARLFKRQTGMTIRGYRLRLRLAVALQDVADGADDLSAVALRTGFADHSHLTTSFRKAFGATPSALRESLGARRLAQMSKFFQASAERSAQLLA